MSVSGAAAAGNENYDLAHKTTDSASPNDSTPVTRTITNACLDIPTELPGVVTVAANGTGVTKASFSNYGQGVIDVSAPGSSVYSTVPGGGYGMRAAHIPDVVQDHGVAGHMKCGEGFELARHCRAPTPA